MLPLYVLKCKQMVCTDRSPCLPTPLTPWVMVRDCAEPYAKQDITSQPVLLSSEDMGFNFLHHYFQPFNYYSPW